jgi:hypothetical protein
MSTKLKKRTKRKMSNLIENVLIQNDKMNVKLSGTGDSIKLLTTKDIKNVAELYKMVHEELQQANCDKFLHALNEEQIEELVSNDASDKNAIIAFYGYSEDGFKKKFDENVRNNTLEVDGISYKLYKLYSEKNSK